MLRLARTAGESIWVDDIEIRIMHVGENRVQVGVIAPGREILRGELRRATAESDSEPQERQRVTARV